MPKSERDMPDSPDPLDKLKQNVTACAEKQKGYDIADRIKKAPAFLLERMKNKPIGMMRALLDEWNL